MPSAVPVLGLFFAALQAPTLEVADLQARIEQHFPRLVSARADVEAARGRLRSKKGAFDPVFTVDRSHLLYNSSSNRGKAYTTEMTEGVVEVQTRSGVSLFAGSRLNIGDVKSPRSSTGSLGEYFVGLKLPLMRGYGLNDKNVAEQQASIGVEVADRDVDVLRLGSLRSGLGAYYRWIAAGKKREIAARLLEIAKTRVEQIRARVERLDLARVELVEMQTEVQRREGQLAAANRELASAKYTLGLYLWQDGDPFPLLGEPPKDLPVPTQLIPDTADKKVEQAVQKRPEIEAIGLSSKAVKLSLDHARNDRKPQLDFVVSPGFDNGQKSIGPTAKMGIFYSLPLVQNTVDGRIDEAVQKLKSIEIDREFLVQQIRTEVLDAINGVEQAFRRYEAAKAEVALAEELERLERVRYEAGDGTLFLLIQRERATAEARSREIDVIAEYQQAQLALRAATADF